MKKFISCVAAATIVLSVISCREAEQMDELSSVQKKSTAKVELNHTAISATTENNDVVEADKNDPPVKKDPTHW